MGLGFDALINFSVTNQFFFREGGDKMELVIFFLFNLYNVLVLDRIFMRLIFPFHFQTMD